MIIEGVIENLIASAIGALALTVAGKVFNDYYYLGFSLPNKEKKGLRLKVFRKLPWRHAYKYASQTAISMKDGKADQLYEPTIIIGIGRGGAIYGSIFSYYMKEAPLLSLDRRYYFDDDNKRVEDWYYPIDIPHEFLKRVLLIAGEYHSGKTMKVFKARLKAIGAEEIRSCVLYYQTGGNAEPPDYFGICNSHDCLMPWQEKHFLRTWKDSNDAKVREHTLRVSDVKGLKEGFFLMRHAKTTANEEDRFIGSGSPDESITAEGRLEARNVGLFLKETVGRIDVIYTSPMKRCVQTATEVQCEAGGDIILDDRLVEADFGNWEGVIRADIPEEEYDLYVHDQTYRIPGSNDSYASRQEKIHSFLDELVRENALYGKRVLVVTHKVIGRMMVQAIEHKERQHFRSIPMENASLRRIVFDNEDISIPYYIKVLDGDVVE